MDRTLIIDGLNDTTLARLETAARDRGIGPGELARKLLEQSVGSIASTSHDLDSLAGTWSIDEAKAFDAATSEMRSIDPEPWR